MKILVVGSHPDDVEHSMGATIFKFRQKHHIRYICFSKCIDLPRNKGIMSEYNRVISRMNVESEIFDFPNRKLPEYSFEIREKLEKEKENFNPDVVFTHSPSDIHQDHYTIYEETLRVFRNVSILGYEVIRSCIGFNPNFYIEISQKELQNKTEILNLYETQKDMYYMRGDVIDAKAKVRGSDIGKPLAEAFEVIRLIGGVL